MVSFSFCSESRLWMLTLIFLALSANLREETVSARNC